MNKKVFGWSCCLFSYHFNFRIVGIYCEIQLKQKASLLHVDWKGEGKMVEKEVGVL